MDPRAGDVDEAGGDDQLDPGALQRPPELAQSGRSLTPRRRAGDDVDPQVHCQRGRLLLGADDGDAVDGLPGVAAGGRDHGEAGVGGGAQVADQRGEVGGVADDEDVIGILPAAAMGPEPHPPHPASEQQGREPEREGDEDVTTGQLDLGQIADDGECREESEGRRDHGAVFLGAVAEHPRVVCRVQPQHGQPEHDDPDGHPGVLQLEAGGHGIGAIRDLPETQQMGPEHSPADDDRVGDGHSSGHAAHASPTVGRSRRGVTPDSHPGSSSSVS